MAFIPPILFPRIVDRKDDPHWINLAGNSDPESDLILMETEHKDSVINSFLLFYVFLFNWKL